MCMHMFQLLLMKYQHELKSIFEPLMINNDNQFQGKLTELQGNIFS